MAAHLSSFSLLRRRGRERNRAEMLLPALTWLLLTSAAAADNFDLVYKGCATQSFPVYPQQSLSTLTSALTARSAAAKFYKTSVPAVAGEPGLFGLFQCRGDLGPADCAACVARIPPMWARLCGPTVAARVHLSGCYALYQVSSFPAVSGVKMLYKACSSAAAAALEEKRDTVLANLESVMASGSAGGYYATSFAGVYAVGQCEGDLSTSDCGSCVTQAAQKAQVECGGAAAAAVYLDKCYVSYSAGGAAVVSGGGGGGGGYSSGGGGGGAVGQPTGKTVAIVVGGAAGVGFLVIVLLFVRSLYKKRDDD